MAIVSCPYCGKRITDRMVKCPHCSADLIKRAEQVITKEEIKASAKGSLVSAAIATVLTLITARIWGFVTMRYASVFGLATIAAVGVVQMVFFTAVLLPMIAGAVLFCLISVRLKQNRTKQLGMGLILTLLLCIVCYIVQYTVTLHSGTLSPEVVHYSKMLSLGFGVTFPILLGSFSIISYGKSLKKSLLIQVLLVFAFVIMAWILDALFVSAIKLSVVGLALGGVIPAIIVLAVAVFTGKGFQKLISHTNFV